MSAQSGVGRSGDDRARLFGLLLGAIVAVLVFVVVFVVALIATAAPASALNVEIVNSSGRPASGIYLTLEHGSSSDGQLPDETPTPLSQIRNSTFSLGTISAGRLYVSYGGPVTTKEPPLAPTRYDKIELTNPGVADLTAVDFFAIPFNMQSLDASGATVGDAVGYRCFTSTLLQHLRPLGPGAEVTSGGQFVRFLSPQLASPGTFPSLAPYVESMVGQTIEVNDTFAKEHEAAKAIHYAGTFEPGGSITLTGTVGGVAGQPLHIEGATLPEAVYTGDGAYTVGSEAANVLAEQRILRGLPRHRRRLRPRLLGRALRQQHRRLAAPPRLCSRALEPRALPDLQPLRLDDGRILHRLRLLLQRTRAQ